METGENHSLQVSSEFSGIDLQSSEWKSLLISKLRVKQGCNRHNRVPISRSLQDMEDGSRRIYFSFSFMNKFIPEAIITLVRFFPSDQFWDSFLWDSVECMENWAYKFIRMRKVESRKWVDLFGRKEDASLVAAKSITRLHLQLLEIISGLQTMTQRVLYCDDVTSASRGTNWCQLCSPF